MRDYEKNAPLNISDCENYMNRDTLKFSEAAYLFCNLDPEKQERFHARNRLHVSNTMPIEVKKIYDMFETIKWQEIYPDQNYCKHLARALTVHIMDEAIKRKIKIPKKLITAYENRHSIKQEKSVKKNNAASELTKITSLGGSMEQSGDATEVLRRVFGEVQDTFADSVLKSYTNGTVKVENGAEFTAITSLARQCNKNSKHELLYVMKHLYENNFSLYSNNLLATLMFKTKAKLEDIYSVKYVINYIHEKCSQTTIESIIEHITYEIYIYFSSTYNNERAIRLNSYAPGIPGNAPHEWPEERILSEFSIERIIKNENREVYRKMLQDFIANITAFNSSNRASKPLVPLEQAEIKIYLEKTYFLLKEQGIIDEKGNLTGVISEEDASFDPIVLPGNKIIYASLLLVNKNEAVRAKISLSKPDYDEWVARGGLRLSEAAYLFCDIDPHLYADKSLGEMSPAVCKILETLNFVNWNQDYPTYCNQDGTIQFPAFINEGYIRNLKMPLPLIDARREVIERQKDLLKIHIETFNPQSQKSGKQNNITDQPVVAEIPQIDNQTVNAVVENLLTEKDESEASNHVVGEEKSDIPSDHFIGLGKKGGSQSKKRKELVELVCYEINTNNRGCTDFIKELEDVYTYESRPDSNDPVYEGYHICQDIYLLKRSDGKLQMHYTLRNEDGSQKQKTIAINSLRRYFTDVKKEIDGEKVNPLT